MSNKITIVTAADTRYIEKLALVYPNWCKFKKIEQYPMIVYVNGFDNILEDVRLKFLQNKPHIDIIKWDMPQATSQRERMLSAFVLGVVRDVKTNFFVKLDADAFFTNDYPLIEDYMFNYVVYGHKWGYTKPKYWIKQLDEWAVNIPEFQGTLPLFDEKNLHPFKNHYACRRFASYVCFHDKNFVEFAAKLATIYTQSGQLPRLPVPSHDTYLWYVAERLKLKWGRENFKKKRGVTNCSNYFRIKEALERLENGLKNG